MASFLNVCRFTPTAGGTTDWTFLAAVTGFQSPSSAGVVNGATYRYRAESADLTQWEIGTGTYNTGTGVLTRATVLYNSSATGTGSGQSGAGTKISFTVAPQVAIVVLNEDLGALQPGQIPGTTTNDNASAGNVGEFVSSSVVKGSAVAMTTTVSVNVTSISLTAGDWDVSAMCLFTGGATTTVNRADVSLSTTTGTLNTTPGQLGTIVPGGIAAIGFDDLFVNVGATRFSLSATTTVFLVVQAAFGTSTMSAYGILRARRMR